MAKTFLSIGAGPGIALATARRFAKADYDIVLASRNAQRLGENAATLRAEGFKVSARTVDASNAHSIAKLVQEIGPDLDVLHYNAGVLHYDANANLQPRTLQAESIESVVSDLQVNLSSALVAIREALPAMTAKQRGTVLLTGGGFGVQPSASFLNLSVGKAGIRALALAMFEPLKQQGIHIATVTVCKIVTPNTPQTAAIADEFWKLHDQPLNEWKAEAVYV